MQVNKFNNLSVVEIVDKIIFDAISHGASDIHLEAMEDYLRLRYRIDGILYDQEPIGFHLIQHIVSRIKVISNIDIAQRRVPHDGKFKLIINKNSIDFRVSTFPCVYGEKVVIRILDRLKTTIDLHSLGLSDLMLGTFKDLISKSSGFILVTGPTGSGKTTTLYSALCHVNSPHKNIITLEDPVEYHIEGVTQGQINLGSGFTFAKGIRSLLRQDPDIAMIGEIRDKESAQIAIEAALTGHLVFSTLHTNNAPSAIMRFMDMGIEPFLINAALSGVLAQRLARKVCNDCKIQKNPNAQQLAIMKRLNLHCDALYEGQGCNNCGNLGYKGRAGIFELLVISDQLRSLIVKNPSFQMIYARVVDDGMCTLLQDGFQKVKDGIISFDELVRVII